MDITFLGAGHVGVPTAAVMASKWREHRFIVYDIDSLKIDCFKRNILPFHEPGLGDLLPSLPNIHFTSNPEEAFSTPTLIFLCVQTPFLKNKGYHLNNLRQAIFTLRNYPNPHLQAIVEKSTVPVMSVSHIREWLGNIFSDVAIVSNPEFLSQGTALKDLMVPDRVLIGGDNEHAVSLLHTLYHRWVPRANIITTDTFSSELGKIAANCFLAQRLASINSLASLCEALPHTNVSTISTIVGSDSRIGSTYLQASMGFGGSCLLKDLKALVFLAETMGCSEVAQYWRAILDMNTYQQKRFSRLIMDILSKECHDPIILVLGLAYKKDTDDIRDSPALKICKYLLKMKASLSIHDPLVKGVATDICPLPPIHNDENVTILAKNRRALVILLDSHSYSFDRLDYKVLYSVMAKPAYIFDGRNIFCNDQQNKLKKIGFVLFIFGNSSLQE